VVKAELRCHKCNKKLGENLSGRFEVVCPRCRYYNVFDTIGERIRKDDLSMTVDRRVNM